MTVATFLAGFVSAALVTNLFVDDFTPSKQVAAVLLTFALALLIITVYIYDELGMPEGYWGRGSRSRFRRLQESRREARRERRWNGTRMASNRSMRASLNFAGWTTPNGTWAIADEHEAQLLQDGPLYTWMVATWRFVFTPALALALAGFGILIFDAGSRITGVACVVGVVITLAWLTLRRPPLGTD